MPALSWNEIQDRAVEFAAKWQNETYEKGESQSFWSDFLRVFGVDRKRHGAFFEYAIKKNGGSQGFIDMFWPGKLLAEQKSGGRDLSTAQIQARGYLHTMPDHDLPRGIVVSDFASFEFVDLETDELTKFNLEDLPKHVKLFGFLINESSRKLAEQDPVNRRAAEAMAALHNELRDTGYTGTDLEVLLVRLVFCLFADDSGIFERGSFEDYVYNRTELDGSDLGPRLVKLFEVLNTPDTQRSSNLDQSLAAFEYINGGLFKEQIRIPDFNHRMRDALLGAMQLDWSQVSPAIFGSMFQGVMDEKQRRNLGAHYTSEKNILRVIKPLFLDELYDEFASIGSNGTKLRAFHDKLANLAFLDPACGCGNFLVITYRELRLLEHKVLEKLYGKKQGMFDIGSTGLIKLNVDQMYGIEIEEFPSLIAQTALWLTDHQMNLEFSHASGRAFKRIPLTTSPTIVHANALTTPWESVIAPKKLNYILGNPPFIGSKLMNEAQRRDLLQFFDQKSGAGVLDFVSAWYAKAVRFYMNRNKQIQAALVSTNSITQGEQVGKLWDDILEQSVVINFAHRTFKWSNDAKGNAAVYCVIIGFSFTPAKVRRLFEYPDIKGEPVEVKAKNINPYLMDAPNVFVESRNNPICDVPKMQFGNMPLDGGNLLLSDDEKASLIDLEPKASQFIVPFIGAKEFLQNKSKWCIWLKNVEPERVRALPEVYSRVAKVKAFRLASRAPSTQLHASRPAEFRDTANPPSYILITRVTSENRAYIPIGLFGKNEIAGDTCMIIPNAELYDFGILTSQIHMAWMRAVAGRLKSDYRYSKDIVYNNFIWPEATDAQKAEIEQLAQSVLEARAKYPEATLADLYDAVTMPPDLTRAHKTLDKAVDKLYRKEPFQNDSERVALLFRLYQQKTS